MRTLRGFIVGLIVGAAGFWFFTDTAPGRDLFDQGRATVAGWIGEDPAGRAETAVKDLQDDAEDMLARAGRVADDVGRAAGEVDVAAAVQDFQDDAQALATRAHELAMQAAASFPDLETLANTLNGWQEDMAALELAADAGDEEVAAMLTPTTTAVMESTGFSPIPEFHKCPVIEVSNSGPVGDDLTLLDYTPWMTTPAGPLIRAPVGSACLSSGFGSRTVNGEPRNHGGVDYYNRSGAPIFAAGDGVVIHAGEDGAFGESVRIDHGDGVVGLYAHMVPGSLKVSDGDTVHLGDQIGTMGRSGRAYAVHLHYEVRFDDRLIDPLRQGKRATFSG